MSAKYLYKTCDIQP